MQRTSKAVIRESWCDSPCRTIDVSPLLAFDTLRSAGCVPTAALVGAATNALTVLSTMAFGLGLDDLLTRAGRRITSAAILSLAALGALSLGPNPHPRLA